MSSTRPIEIIGGGLAGLSLGLALQNVGIAVRVIEAGNYPAFYNQVAAAIKGQGDMPVPVADAMEVARLIDVAREMSVR
jgi:monoamine oxidase